MQKKRREVKTVNDIRSSSQLARRLVAKPLPTFSACSNRVNYLVFFLCRLSQSLFPTEPASAKVRKVQNRNPLTFLTFHFQMSGTIRKSFSDHIPAIGAAKFSLNEFMCFLLRKHRPILGFLSCISCHHRLSPPNCSSLVMYSEIPCCLSIPSRFSRMISAV